MLLRCCMNLKISSNLIKVHLSYKTAYQENSDSAPICIYSTGRMPSLYTHWSLANLHRKLPLNASQCNEEE